MAATEALKVQVETLDETLALICEQILAARRERDNAIRLVLSQQANMVTQFASINTAIRSHGEVLPANLAKLRSIIM